EEGEAVGQLAGRDLEPGLRGELALAQGLVSLGLGARRSALEPGLLLVARERDLAHEPDLAGAEALDGDAVAEELALEPDEDEELAPEEAALLDEIAKVHGASSGDGGEDGRFHEGDRLLLRGPEADARGGGVRALRHEAEAEGRLEDLAEGLDEARRLVPE